MRNTVATVLILAVACATAGAQVVHHHTTIHFASNVVIPQSRVLAVHRQPKVQITGVVAGVVILQQVATTTLDISLKNPTGARLEAELVVPVPQGAVVRGFSFEGSAKEPTARLLPKEEAARTYKAIVAKIKDPALLEFVGCNLVRSSVFPVPPRGAQKVRLTYEHLLPADGNRIDYVLPRTEAIDYSVPWTVNVRIKSKVPVSTVYSPSHALDVVRASPGVVSARVSKQAVTQPGAIRISYLLQKNGMAASLLAYPDPKTKGGYFLLLAGLPAETPKDAGKIRREVTLVLDNSGSMRGEKLEQVREAALQVIEGLEAGEAFNILVYNSSVQSMSGGPVIKNADTIQAARKYLKSIRAGGGTNIHDAMVEALRQKPTKDMLPLVLFLTDGLPTIGVTSEKAIREVVRKANPHRRRVFTFGVGADVNTALLERVALETRASSTFVLPKEDVEVKVASVYKRLSGPIVADPTVAVVTLDGKPAVGRTLDILPERLPDLFEGDQLVLLGRYVGEEPLHFRLRGNYLGKTRTFKFAFSLEKATTRNAFVPRLWASRRIAVLVDAIRALGADNDANLAQKPIHNPKMKELVDEIVHLSKEFGVLTEYTAFLALEGTDLSQRDQVLSEASGNFTRRAMGHRIGINSVNQDYNRRDYRGQKNLNYGNTYWDENMNRVSISNVQQVNDRAFFQRRGRWIDSRILEQEAKQPGKVIRFGSEEFQQLATRLANEGRSGCIALRGDILLSIDGETVLVKAPEFAAAKAAKAGKAGKAWTTGK